MDTSEVLVRVVEMPIARLEHGSLSYCHNEQGFEYIDATQKDVGY